MNAKEIIFINLKGLKLFIQQYFVRSDENLVLKEMDRYIESWHETWPRIQNWLAKSDEKILLDRNGAIQNFMITILPPATAGEFYEEIKCHLKNSFILHETFWNQFFENLLVAKSKLSQQHDE